MEGDEASENQRRASSSSAGPSGTEAWRTSAEQRAFSNRALTIREESGGNGIETYKDMLRESNLVPKERAPSPTLDRGGGEVASVSQVRPEPWQNGNPAHE